MKRFSSGETPVDPKKIPAPEARDRTDEWFVPKFGPRRIKALLGLLFLPYTGMVISYSVIGSMLAPRISWDRVAAITIIYCLGLGVGAHALDAIGGKGVKPWGQVLGKGYLWMLAFGSLLAAYSVAGYYIVKAAPLLLVVAIVEGFFVFSYNLEWFEGKFHNDASFAFSWGFLPVLAGYILQTNRVSPGPVLVAVSMSLFSVIEIRASRPYKALKRRAEVLSPAEILLMQRYEVILKNLSLGVILLGGGFLFWRLAELR